MRPGLEEYSGSVSGFVQIGSSYRNIDTITRIEDEPGQSHCVVVFDNGERLRVKDEAREVIRKVADAAGGAIPLLAQSDSEPQIH